MKTNSEIELGGEALEAAADNFIDAEDGGAGSDDDAAAAQESDDSGVGDAEGLSACSARLNGDAAGSGEPGDAGASADAALLEDAIAAAIRFGEARADAAAAPETAARLGSDSFSSRARSLGQERRADAIAAENIHAFRGTRGAGLGGVSGQGRNQSRSQARGRVGANEADAVPIAAAPPRPRQLPRPRPRRTNPPNTVAAADANPGGVKDAQIALLKAQLEKSEARTVELNMSLRMAQLARRKAEEALEEEAEWNTYLVDLLRYRVEHGDFFVPKKHGGGKRGSLGWWVSYVRKIKRDREAGKSPKRTAERDYLTEARIDMLDVLGFPWHGYKTSYRQELTPAEEEEGRKSVEELREEKEAKKKAAVKEKKAEKKAAAEREEEEAWRDSFCKLCAYRATFGDCAVMATYEGGRKGSLGHWVKRMRQLKRERETFGAGAGGCLTEDRIKILDSLKFVWQISERTRRSADERPWDDFYKELQNYKELHGHANVPQSHGGGQIGSLGHFVRKTKATKRGRDVGRLTEDALTDEQIRKLDEVGFVWSTPRDDPKQKFEDRIKELLEYKDVFGNVCPPTDKSPLGKWVHYQRGRYRERKKQLQYIEEHGTNIGWHKVRNMASISQEEIDRLDQIGFVWIVKTVPDLGWDAQYEELLAYYHANGHCDVPQSYKGKRTLGRWVMRQRVIFGHKKNGKLKSTSEMMSDERIAKLEAIGFKWSMAGVKRKREEQYEEYCSDSSDHEEEQEDEPQSGPYVM